MFPSRALGSPLGQGAETSRVSLEHVTGKSPYILTPPPAPYEALVSPVFLLRNQQWNLGCLPTGPWGHKQKLILQARE